MQAQLLDQVQNDQIRYNCFFCFSVYKQPCVGALVSFY